MSDEATETPETDADAEDTETSDADVDGATPDKDADADGASDADSLVARVAEHDEELATDVRDLRERVERLESDLAERDDRIEELESKLKRKQADFQNYKKRAKKREEQTKARATEDLVERLVAVRDNLVRALEQDESVDIRDGVEATLAEFDRVLDEENVSAIEPQAGDEVDPTRHEVMMRVESDEPEGRVVDVYRPGYEMAEKVIQTAQVTVSDGD